MTIPTAERSFSATFTDGECVVMRFESARTAQEVYGKWRTRGDVLTIQWIKADFEDGDTKVLK